MRHAKRRAGPTDDRSGDPGGVVAARSPPRRRVRVRARRRARRRVPGRPACAARARGARMPPVARRAHPLPHRRPGGTPVMNADSDAVGPPVAVLTAPPQPRDPAGEESAGWLSSLRSTGPERELAIGRLHALLLRAARFEAARRRPTLVGVGARELD